MAEPAINELELGARLRAARRARKLTQADLARRSGVSRAFVIDLEHGRRAGAELGRVLAVIRALGLGVLLAEDDRPSFDEALDALLDPR